MWLNERACEQIPAWKYALLALADVEGNFLVVSAYQYTSIASVMLLDCFAIPVVMLLSALFLNAKVRASGLGSTVVEHRNRTSVSGGRHGTHEWR